MKDKTLDDVTLTLFFTGGMSLSAWAEVGNLDRELEIYKKLNEKLKKINIVTYGGNKDRLYSTRIGKINLLSTFWYDNHKRTLFYLLFKYFPNIYRSDIFKTNQIFGSDIPLWLKKKFKKKLVTRCGFLYSYFIRKQTHDDKKINEVTRLEKNAFSLSDLGIVTSSWQRNLVINTYDIKPEKIRVIPNYVVTTVFKPNPKIRKEYDLIFIGRADTQKNIHNLLRAIYYLKKRKRNITLLMIGGCSYNKEIKEAVDNYSIDVTFKGNIPNFKLPELLNKSKVFILPSYFEGHPKALLEAMSCELPCIGSNINGIREDITHMKNGYLCETGYKSIASAIQSVLYDNMLQKKLGKNAREYVLKKYDVDKILKMELEVIQEVITN